LGGLLLGRHERSGVDRVAALSKKAVLKSNAVSLSDYVFFA
jgi:hypothetical protein